MSWPALKQINWVDILALIVLFRVCYVASKKGLPVELFKLLGTLAAVYISLHYFTVVSDLIRGRVNTEKAPLAFLDFLSFIVLAAVSYLIFVLLRHTFFQFIKMEAVSTLNKWGGLILGIGRGFLLVGLIIFGLVISTVTYLKDSVDKSYSGKRLFEIAPQTYIVLWDNLGAKFMAKEKFNNTVLEVQAGFKRK
jgi:uncharacterized membrane protein required for colicin V production